METRLPESKRDVWKSMKGEVVKFCSLRAAFDSMMVLTGNETSWHVGLMFVACFVCLNRQMLEMFSHHPNYKIVGYIAVSFLPCSFVVYRLPKLVKIGRAHV